MRALLLVSKTADPITIGDPNPTANPDPDPNPNPNPNPATVDLADALWAGNGADSG